MSTTATFNSAPTAVDSPESQTANAGSIGWGVIKTSIIGAVSFGIAPALGWPGKLRETIESEAERLRAAADWATGVDHSPNAAAARRTAASAGANGFLAIVPALLAVFTLIALGMQFIPGQFSVDGLMEHTYRFGQCAMDHQYAMDKQSEFSGADAYQHTRAVYILWCTALSFAYAAQWVQLNLHRSAVRQFVKQFNRAVESHGILPVRMREPGGFRPLLIVGAIMFAQSGAWWGIPMLLAASAQSRYTLVTSRSLAVQFADRMSRVAARRTVERRCGAQGCRALLPLPAKFCPQCGRRVPEPMIDRVG